MARICQRSLFLRGEGGGFHKKEDGEERHGANSSGRGGRNTAGGTRRALMGCLLGSARV